ncbi:hypothetical protein OZ71_gp161 [Staphylococcus phage MCE-2014]|uniref:Uncharacterized protein n=1 Tax=Staphylococcus phage MCE-2014 TaxID=1524910 RepID=A0A076G449_9CAUD|nr:hypothetical protein OZ71_gp161 [Staphylococcus phage MCE-2014]AII27001.1 hypothetical protein [Staphylococcus phage MCE-2014]
MEMADLERFDAFVRLISDDELSEERILELSVDLLNPILEGGTAYQAKKRIRSKFGKIEAKNFKRNYKFLLKSIAQIDQRR